MQTEPKKGPKKKTKIILSPNGEQQKEPKEVKKEQVGTEHIVLMDRK